MARSFVPSCVLPNFTSQRNTIFLLSLLCLLILLLGQGHCFITDSTPAGNKEIKQEGNEVQKDFNNEEKVMNSEDLIELTDFDEEDLLSIEAEEKIDKIITQMMTNTSCYHTTRNNQTVQTIKTSTEPPVDGKAKFKNLKFTEKVVQKVGGEYHHVLGTMTIIDNPYHSLSILEPKAPGTCKGNYEPAPVATVKETTKDHKPCCHVATNAGFFSRLNGTCYGNIVSNGRVVQTSGGIQDANFGIKEDGTIMVGYISDDEVLNKTNPFRMLVTGAMWLVRNGANIVDESMVIECFQNERHISVDNFVHILSARSAIGFDDKGRVILTRIEGKSLVRGVNLFKFADILIKRGVTNAINLDGGGSNTLLEEGTLVNYPADYCHEDKKLYLCPRKVSTVLCVHDVATNTDSSTSDGTCGDGGSTLCVSPWCGEKCELLNCDETDCNGNGACTNGSCKCKAGWYGSLCEKSCPHNTYGPGCEYSCYCNDNGVCHHVTGACICNTGYTGPHCMERMVQ